MGLVGPGYRRTDLGAGTPAQRGQLGTYGIQPCGLVGCMSVPRLLNVACPTVAKAKNLSGDPSSSPWWCQEAMRGPGVRVGRMFQHSTPLADRSKRRRKATAVVTLVVSVTCLDQARKTTPAPARWVGHNRVRARVRACIALPIPDIDVGKARVAAFGGNVERGDHSSVSCWVCSGRSRTNMRAPDVCRAALFFRKLGRQWYHADKPGNLSWDTPSTVS